MLVRCAVVVAIVLLHMKCSDCQFDSNLADYYDTVDEDICCECVPHFLCGENNTIIDDGGSVITPRFGNPRITDVQTCPDVTQLCCGVPNARASCDNFFRNTNVQSGKDTPCECVFWQFCMEDFRISDGTLPTTLIEEKPLEAHAKCSHSLQVCCALLAAGPDTGPTTATETANECFCVNSWLCGTDGYILTDGSGIQDLRNSLSADGPPPCVPPMICCKPPQDLATNTTVVSERVPPINDQRCYGLRNSGGITVRIRGFKQGETQFGEFPWAAMVLSNYRVAGQPMSRFVGGGIIIHPRVILTAAHKVAREVTESLHIRVGEWDIETEFEPAPHQVRDVEQVVVHPRFNKRSLYHDVALLILTAHIDLKPHIRSICLAHSLEDVDTSACVANGWGENAFESGNYQTVMKSIVMPVVPHRRCQALLRRTRLGRWFRLHQSFMCAGGEAGKDACSSDGGGPLACPRHGGSGEYLLVGITAWGLGCGEEGVPGVYANIVQDREWITGTIAEILPTNQHSLNRRAVDAREQEDRNSSANCGTTSGPCASTLLQTPPV